MYKFKVGDRVMHEKFGVGTVLIHGPKTGLFPYLVRYDRQNINLGDVAKGSRIHEVYGIAVDSSMRYSWCAEASLKEVKAKSSDRKPENQKPAPKFKVGDEVEAKITFNLYRAGTVVGYVPGRDMPYTVDFGREVFDYTHAGDMNDGKYNYRFFREKELRLVASPLRPRVRRVVIEITDDGAEAKYIVGKTVEKSASVKRYRDDKPDDGKAAAYAVDKLFALSDAKKYRELAQEPESEFAKQNSAMDNINRILRGLFDIKD